MKHKVFRYHAFFYAWRRLVSGEVLSLILAAFLIMSPAFALRFETRGLTMASAAPGATTSYTVSLQYMSPDPVGSLDLLFCNNPIPYEPCDAPTGLDVSHATLSNQTGEIGFSISSQTPNHIILSRTPTMPVATTPSTYTFSGIVNPTDTSQAFAIRLKSLASTDGSGPQIDFGSVRGEVTNEIVLEAQVPPMLIFCVAQVVNDNCAGTNSNYYTDMGDLSPSATLTAHSQMAVGTNASGGFAITANGTPMAAGTNVIDSPAVPTPSLPGTNEFGINLVANSTPDIGSDPSGIWANAIAAPGYDQPNYFKYVPGDVVAYSPDVSLMKKFTVSYILNSSKDLRAGVYTTTIDYLASGRF